VSGNQQSPVFELFDQTLAETMPEIIGLWITNSGTADSSVAFVPNSETDENVPVWRANFPADLDRATAHLISSEGSLIQSQSALAPANDRVDRLIHSIRSKSDLAFDLPAVGEDLAQPERELLASLQALQQPDVATSFGIGEGVVGLSHQAFERFQSFIARLLQVVTQYAWVETQVEGRTLARTIVGWLGDVNHIWRTGLDAAQISLHQRTVSLALASRDTLLQTFSTAVQTALKLSVLLTMPGGAILLLPIAWKFIDQVMAQSRKGLAHEYI
jgi:hypothetical protein